MTYPHSLEERLLALKEENYVLKKENVELECRLKTLLTMTPQQGHLDTNGGGEFPLALGDYSAGDTLLAGGGTVGVHDSELNQLRGSIQSKAHFLESLRARLRFRRGQLLAQARELSWQQQNRAVKISSPTKGGDAILEGSPRRGLGGSANFNPDGATKIVDATFLLLDSIPCGLQEKAAASLNPNQDFTNESQLVTSPEWVQSQLGLGEEGLRLLQRGDDDRGVGSGEANRDGDGGDVSTTARPLFRGTDDKGLVPSDEWMSRSSVDFSDDVAAPGASARIQQSERMNPLRSEEVFLAQELNRVRTMRADLEVHLERRRQSITSALAQYASKEKLAQRQCDVLSEEIKMLVNQLSAIREANAPRFDPRPFLTLRQ